MNPIITRMLQNVVRSRQIWRDLARSIQDPARFLANRDEKSLVQQDPMFIVPKSANLNEKVVEIWKKWPVF